MPTAAKLISAIMFAIIFWWAGGLYVAHEPTGVILNRLPEKAAMFGAICGWRVLGNEVGSGYILAVSAAIRAMIAGGFWALLCNAIIIMFERAFDRAYRTMIDAFEGMFGLMLQYGKPALEADVVTTLIFGAIITGILAEWTSKRWS